MVTFAIGVGGGVVVVVIAAAAAAAAAVPRMVSSAGHVEGQIGLRIASEAARDRRSCLRACWLAGAWRDAALL